MSCVYWRGAANSERLVCALKRKSESCLRHRGAEQPREFSGLVDGAAIAAAGDIAVDQLDPENDGPNPPETWLGGYRPAGRDFKPFWK
jgi:hypothetical protein